MSSLYRTLLTVFLSFFLSLQVAAGRILGLLNADACVTCISPPTGLNNEVRHRIQQGEISHVARKFLPSDLDDPEISLVLVAIDDPASSSDIWRLCKARRIPANIADVPPECDFYFGSVHRDGPLQIMVSTNGRGPRLAAKIRRWIGERLPSNAGKAVDNIGVLRAKLRLLAPRPEESTKRMRWMTLISDKYSWEEICSLTNEDMNNLLCFYDDDKVPDIEELRAMRRGSEPVDFDGSFGFSVGA